MRKAYDVYNLDEDLDDILEDIATDYEEPIPYVTDCYGLLTNREGFLSFVKRNDDGLFYSCLFDLVSRRCLSETKLIQAIADSEKCGCDVDDLYESYNIETIDESVDNAIYNSYGIDAVSFLTPEFQKSLGYDKERLNYEELGLTNGKRVLFKGGIPKDE